MPPSGLQLAQIEDMQVDTGGVFIVIVFSLLASWLRGFLAFGFLAFRLLGFLAFWLLGFLLVYAAFGGFGFSHPLLSQFLSGLFGFCTLSWFLDLASRIISITSSSLFESSLLRTSWGGSPPPTHPLFRLFAE